ncbi:MAG: hypothetical protein J5674_01250, partial [Candidatus Methanomethylophilaceae archaeon]|nr:hypothetical protein [Candidatus Methanomethylophilaceae archaeon]
MSDLRAVTFAKIPVDEAGPVIRDLMRRGYVDLHAKIGKDDEYRYVPILPEHLGSDALSGMELISGEAHTLDRRTPQER